MCLSACAHDLRCERSLHMLTMLLHCPCCCRFSSNATAEDTDVQFRVWAIKSAVKRLPLYVQVSR